MCVLVVLVSPVEGGVSAVSNSTREHEDVQSVRNDADVSISHI